MNVSQLAARGSDPSADQRSPGTQSLLGRVISVDGSRAVVATVAMQPDRAERPPAVDWRARLDRHRLLARHRPHHAAAAQSQRRGSHRATLVEVSWSAEIRARLDRQPSFDRGVRRVQRRRSAPAPARDTSALETIYDYTGKQTISIGKLSQDDSIEATLRVQDLLQKHFAVLGTTGCGKSSAVALLLDRILKATEATRVLLIDPHNEYAAAFKDEAEVISPRTLSLPFWLFNFEEIVDVIYRRRPGVTEEVELLADLIPVAKARYAQGRSAAPPARWCATRTATTAATRSIRRCRTGSATSLR